MDTEASSYLTYDLGKISTPLSFSPVKSIFVGTGNTIPIHGSDHTNHTNSTRSYNLNNIFLTPNIIKNLLSIQKSTIDNHTIVDFNAFGFSVKGLKTWLFFHATIVPGNSIHSLNHSYRMLSLPPTTINGTIV